MGLFHLVQNNYRSYDKVPDEIQKNVDEALAEAKKMNYSAAVAIYKKIIPKFPEMSILHNNLGCCLARLKKYDEAETEFIEALSLIQFNRDKGTYVSRSYTKELRRNLIKLYKTIISNANKTLPVTSHLTQKQNILQREPKKNTLQKLIRIIQQKGIIVSLKKIPRYLNSKINPLMRWQDKVITLRAEEFDRQNNVTTASILLQADFGKNTQNQMHALYYRGSDSLVFNNALLSLKINFNDYTFIDFGSGKGKALFLASAYSFKKIIGIEFSEVLDAVAQKNISQFTKKTIEAYCMDAIDYKIPDESLVCYFYHPFDEYIMAKVISNIRQAYHLYKKNIIIVYNHFRCYDLFDAEDWLERLNFIGPIILWSSK
jgi:hypothetical protein